MPRWCRSLHECVGADLRGGGARDGGAVAPASREAAQAVGNQACRPCHQAIHDSYARTAMARTSGAASIGLEGAFQHAPSGVSYRVLRDGQHPRLTYERAERDVDRASLQGTHALKYYLGSNTRGRTFLFEIDGFLYQSPINYYAGKKAWEMSPGFAQAREMPLRPVDATCLFCHASRVQPTRPATVHGFDDPAFLQDGVGCERCHGSGAEHVKANGRAAMINPARLTGERRDSICMQCHLEGEARIARAGRSQEDYRPGDRLSEFVTIFVREDDARQRRAAVSHVESLAVSQCKIKSGDALSCLTCHDPHVTPGAAERATAYRAKCLGCHASMAERHHPSRAGLHHMSHAADGERRYQSHGGDRSSDRARAIGGDSATADRRSPHPVRRSPISVGTFGGVPAVGAVGAVSAIGAIGAA